MWRNRDVISARDFTKADLEELFETAKYMEKYAKSRLDVLRARLWRLRFLSRLPAQG